MTKEEFMDLMAGMLEAYPALKNRYKLGRIYDLAKDLPNEVIGHMVTQIGDDAKSCPSINDFKNEISRWKRNYHAKHGRYWGQPEQSAQDLKPFDCLQCIDSVSYTHLTLPTIYSV